MVFFSILMILAKDDKATYDKYLRDFFKFSEEISEKGLGDWKPFKIADPQDMNLYNYVWLGVVQRRVCTSSVTYVN
jgi:hypothetical protein